MLSTSPAWTQPSPATLDGVARRLADTLEEACPTAKPDDLAAYEACAAALRDRDDIPFATSVDWGGEQPSQRLAKKALSRFRPAIFRQLYMSLFSYDGSWTV